MMVAYDLKCYSSFALFSSVGTLPSGLLLKCCFVYIFYSLRSAITAIMDRVLSFVTIVNEGYKYKNSFYFAFVLVKS